MDLVVNQKRLISAVRTVEKIVSKNISLPILNTILLKTDNGRLKLSATNLEIGINYWLGVKINENGEIAVPARVFSDFINNVTDEKLSLITKKNTIFINSENYKTQILGIETKDFPIIPQIKKEASFKINSQKVKTALTSVIDSASLSETRPEISGVYVSISSKKAEFAATDSFRLSEKIIDLLDSSAKTFILPRNTVVEIIRVAENIEGDLSFVVSDNQILIYGDDFEIISRLIDGHYPEYKRVIPEKFVALAKVQKSEFEKSIRMASIFSSSISDIKIKADKDLMEISAKNSDRGEIAANLACEIKNKPFEISVNYHYLLDGLKSVSTDHVILEFTGDGGPLVIKGENQKDHTYVIMPLRNLRN
ncbi:MAG: DNA polymerase III subunit beta [Candidatus Yanofskybacteria bacterium]|nr:DNA polymerase III subunit beta [Candidatus Yanofskybacteria bacterium]